MSSEVHMPTQQQIAEATAAIRLGWSAEEHHKRRCVRPAKLVGSDGVRELATTAIEVALAKRRDAPGNSGSRPER